MPHPYFKSSTRDHQRTPFRQNSSNTHDMAESNEGQNNQPGGRFNPHDPDNFRTPEHKRSRVLANTFGSQIPEEVPASRTSLFKRTADSRNFPRGGVFQ